MNKMQDSQAFAKITAEKVVLFGGERERGSRMERKGAERVEGNQPWSIRMTRMRLLWGQKVVSFSPGTCKMATQIEMLLPMPQWVIFISIFTVFPLISSGADNFLLICSLHLRIELVPEANNDVFQMMTE